MTVMTVTTPQPPVDYTSRDWSSFVQMMLDAASTFFPAWTNRTPNDFGVVLIEAFAYVGDILSFYIDRAANESFISTATQRSSILALADQLNYTPNGAAASTTVVTLTMPAAADLTIPAGTQFFAGYDSNGDPIYFSSDADVVVTPTGGTTQTVDVAVTQGISVVSEALGTSCGFTDTSFSLAEAPVVDGSVIVYVLETPFGTPNVWQRVDHLLDYGPTDNVYSTLLDEFGGITVFFGDGVNGRIPPTGSVVTATYRTGGGDEGNVDANTLTPVDPITGTGIDTTSDVTETNVAATGGADAEDTESIRVNAPRQLTALNRAVALNDYPALALRVPTVAKASAAAAVYTNVVVFIAPSGGGAPTTTLLNAVRDFFGPDKVMAGVTVTPASPTFTSIDISADIVVLPQFNRIAVQTAVLTALSNVFAFSAVDFGMRITLAAVFQAVLAVPGVAYLNITKLDRSGGSAAADVQLLVDELPIAGEIVLTSTGGTEAGSSVSTSSGTAPGAPGAPTVTDVLFDGTVPPGTWSANLAWTAGTLADGYTVRVEYLAAAGSYPANVVKRVTVDVGNVLSTALSLPGIDNSTRTPPAVTARIVIEAYNGSIGPVLSSFTAVAYSES